MSVAKNYEDMIKLREKGYTYQSIGNIYGVTRQMVFSILKKHNATGRIPQDLSEMSKITINELKTIDHNELAKSYGLPIVEVQKLKKLYGVRKRHKWSVAHRQKSLCNIIFGEFYTPTEYFSELIEELTEHLSDHLAKIAKSFYLEGNSAGSEGERKSIRDKWCTVVNSKSIKDYSKYIKRSL
jgi:predicted transcriptional regulator